MKRETSLRPVSKDQILGSLPTLTKADLQALQTVIGGLLGNGATKQAPNPNDPQVWLFEALAATLHLRQSYYPAFMASPVGKTFNKNAPVALGFMTDVFEVAMGSKTSAIGLMRYLLGLLVADLKVKKVPVTRNSIVSNLIRLPEVFENAYPGYIQSGVAKLVMLSVIGRHY